MLPEFPRDATVFGRRDARIATARTEGKRLWASANTRTAMMYGGKHLTPMSPGRTRSRPLSPGGLEPLTFGSGGSQAGRKRLSHPCLSVFFKGYKTKPTHPPTAHRRRTERHRGNWYVSRYVWPGQFCALCASGSTDYHTNQRQVGGVPYAASHFSVQLPEWRVPAMWPTDPFEHELVQVADECGLTREQRRAVADFYRRQVCRIMEIAADLVADEGHVRLPDVRTAGQTARRCCTKPPPRAVRARRSHERPGVRPTGPTAKTSVQHGPLGRVDISARRNRS